MASTGTLRARIALSGDAPATGVIFVISGFGEDNNVGFTKHLREHIVSAHGLAGVSIDYHAGRNRIQNGARLQFEHEDLRLLTIVDKATPPPCPSGKPGWRTLRIIPRDQADRFNRAA